MSEPSEPSIEKTNNFNTEVEDLTCVVRSGHGHGLDYLNKDLLANKINAPVTLRNAVLIASSELIANALAKNPSNIKFSAIEHSDPANEVTRYQIIIGDDGAKKFVKEDLLKVLDYDHASSSKRGLFTKRPGCKGNALKATFALVFILAEEAEMQTPEITIKSNGRKFAFTLSRNILKEQIDHTFREEDIEDDGFTTLEVNFEKKHMQPSESTLIKLQLNKSLLAIRLLNPWSAFDYSIQEIRGSWQSVTTKPKSQREKTSALFYTQNQLSRLLLEYAQTRPNLKLKDLANDLFRDFSTDEAFQNLQKSLMFTRDEKNPVFAKNPNFTFDIEKRMGQVPAEMFDVLAVAMKKLSNPIQKRAIPRFLLPYSTDAKYQNEISKLRESSIKKIAELNSWTNPRYYMESILINRCPHNVYHNLIKNCNDADHIEFPVILEVAAFDRPEDGQGPQVIESVNYIPSLDSYLFEKIYPILNHLIRAGVNKGTPLTLMVHLITPVQDWLNEGKTDISLPEISEDLERLFKKILPIRKKPKPYKPKRANNFVPRGQIGNLKYEIALRNFADFVKAEQGKLQQTRPKLKFGARSWGYYLEDGVRVSKGDFDAIEKAIGDARKLGYLPILGFIAEDQDETRHFSGILNPIDPSHYLQELKEDVFSMLNRLAEINTNFWTGEKYFVMMLTEKGDMKRLFKPICDTYHVPIASTKGWSPIENRALVAQFSKIAEERGQTPVLLLFYDLDIAGRKISTTFRKNLKDCEQGTGYDPGTELNPKLIIERFGLNKDQVDKYCLTWINNLLSSNNNDLAGTDPGYEREIGRRKCESNAIFKNEQTIHAAEQICSEAIEKYHGTDAISRFGQKEEQTKQGYGDIYNAPIWNQFAKAMDELTEIYRKKEAYKENHLIVTNELVAEIKKEGNVYYYGQCPKCKSIFNYDISEDIGKVKVCPQCKTPMRLVLKEKKLGLD